MAGGFRADMEKIRADMVAERIAISSYQEMMETILEKEAQHADDMLGLFDYFR